MQVTKRNGTTEPVKFEKILKRIQRQSKDLKNCDATMVAQKVIQGLFDGVTTVDLDNLAIETSYSLSVRHPEYDELATRLAITALHKETEPTFSLAVEKLQEHKNPRNENEPLLSDIVYKFIKKHSSILDSTIDHKRDFNFDFFGFKTLKRYLLEANGKIVERPQYLWMRVACGLHFDDIEAAIQTYHLLSTFQFTHATPTLLHAGKEKNQLFSCYLKSINDDQDSIKGIYGALGEIAQLSKYAGGIGFHAHNIRSKGQYIKGGGRSDGLVPMLRVFDGTAKYCNQSGKRKGSFACYLEPWHPDIFDFLDLRKNHGKEELRARDLFTALWVPDLFMKMVEEDGDWYLMDPYICKGLSEIYDDFEDEKFTKLYYQYVDEHKYERKIKARELWQAILISQMETGTPYLLAKDACNRKSNQKNLGTIKSSNLCLAGDTKVWVKDAKNNLIKWLVGPKRESQKYVPSEQEYVMSLQDVCKNYIKGDRFYVKSYDLESKQIVWKFITNAALTKKNAEVLKITNACECRSRSLICTPDHQIYTHNHGYKNSQDIKQRDILQLDLSQADEAEQCLCESINVLDQFTQKIDVYDLTVEDTNCFFANDILVHNCAEIIEYSDPNETAVCVLGSLSLPAYVEGRTKKKFNFERLEENVEVLTKNLNKAIDYGFYPIESAKNSNFKHRPIGIGIQGLANTFALMRFSWESEEAKKLNRDIAETIYYAALKAGCELAKKDGPYSSFQGSPFSQGKFQFDLWGVTPSKRYDWEALRQDIMEYGLRNSLYTACMPTATTSQILGNSESFEPFTSNLFKRQTLSGEFVQINKYLVEDLMELGLWNEEMRQTIIAHNGSIQNIKEIPVELKELYKTVWEIKQRTLIDLATDRAPFIDQSQSMNLYIKDISIAKLSSALMYAWKKGLKTLSYYIRNTASREAIKFTVDQKIQESAQKLEEGIACSIDNREACEMCSA